MNMKQRMAKLLTAVLLLCMLLPQTALAVTRTYLEVTITETKAPATTKSGTSGYLGGSEKLTAEVVGVINQLYNRTSGTGELEAFGSPAMKAVMNAGLDAYADGTDAWNTWVESSYRSVVRDENEAAAALGFKEKLIDLATPVNALTANTAYQISYAPADVDPTDRASGNTYIVTVTLRAVSSGSSSGGTTVTYPITNDGKRAENGTVTVSDSSAAVGKTVTVSVKPDDGYRLNQLIVILDKNGKAVKYTAKGNDTYTFQMPAGGVTVDATFGRAIYGPAETGVSAVLNTTDRIAYLQGKADGNFYPAASVTRGQVAVIFYRLLKNVDVVRTVSFSDVPEGFWCADAVNTLASLGIIKGMGDGTFAPDRPITRAQFVAIATRFADIAVTGETFTDVPETYWAYEAISTASGCGWINGVGGGLFAPEQPITRAQAAVIVNRMLGRVIDEEEFDAAQAKTYADVPETYWAWYDISEASSGVIPR